MSLFAKFMLRRGWIQLSRYGLQMGEDGQVRGLAEPIAALPAQSAPFFTPPAYAPNGTQPVRAPLVPAPAPTPEVSNECDEEERAWQAAMTKARAQTTQELAVADTDRLSAAAVLAGKPERDPDTVVEMDELTIPADEDWDELIAAAYDRAGQSEEATVVTQAPAPEELGDFVPKAPLVGAQVEQNATPANDDMPADLVTSIHHNRFALPSIAVGIENPASEEEDWGKLRADAEEKARAEQRRKQRAMHEIRRLQKNSGPAAAGLPPRSRFAAGTTNVPNASLPSPVMAAARARAESASGASEQSEGDSTRVDLPQATRHIS